MNINQYSKITATLSSDLQSKPRSVVILTSSNEKVDVYDCALKLCETFIQTGKAVILVDARIADATNAVQSDIVIKDSVPTITLTASDKTENIINIEYATNLFATLKEVYSSIIVCCNALTHSSAAYYLTAKSDGVVLVEEKKLSRSDHIDATIETIKNLNAIPLGFIFKR